MHPKLYLVTREDLRPGDQATQSAHAAFTFSYQHGPIFRAWYEDSQVLVLLAVPDEAALAALRDEAKALNLPVVSFHEPDMDDDLTAIAIAPSPKTSKLCAYLPLALREAEMA